MTTEEKKTEVVKLRLATVEYDAKTASVMDRWMSSFAKELQGVYDKHNFRFGKQDFDMFNDVARLPIGRMIEFMDKLPKFLDSALPTFKIPKNMTDGKRRTLQDAIDHVGTNKKLYKKLVKHQPGYVVTARDSNVTHAGMYTTVLDAEDVDKCIELLQRTRQDFVQHLDKALATFSCIFFLNVAQPGGSAGMGGVIVTDAAPFDDERLQKALFEHQAIVEALTSPKRNVHCLDIGDCTGPGLVIRCKGMSKTHMHIRYQSGIKLA